MVWGANAERVCVPETYAVEVPEDVDPAEVGCFTAWRG
jgi:NADPH2:quinone reductase